MIPTESVVIVRNSGGGVDAYGDPITGTETSTTLAGCLVADAGSFEPTERSRVGAVSDYVVYAPIGADVLHTDLIEIRGARCTITGVPEDWRGDPRWQYVIHAKIGVG